MKKKNSISTLIKLLAFLFVFALIVQSCHQAPKEAEKVQIVEVEEPEYFLLRPETEKACYEDAVWILQNTMLGTKEDMDLIAKAILKIQAAVCG